MDEKKRGTGDVQEYRPLSIIPQSSQTSSGQKTGRTVECTDAPLVGLLDAHDLDGLEDGRDAAWAKATCGHARSLVEDLCKLIGLERAAWLPFQSVVGLLGLEARMSTPKKGQKGRRHAPCKGPPTWVPAILVDCIRARSAIVGQGP